MTQFSSFMCYKLCQPFEDIITSQTMVGSTSLWAGFAYINTFTSAHFPFRPSNLSSDIWGPTSWKRPRSARRPSRHRSLRLWLFATGVANDLATWERGSRCTRIRCWKRLFAHASVNMSLTSLRNEEEVTAATSGLGSDASTGRSYSLRLDPSWVWGIGEKQSHEVSEVRYKRKGEQLWVMTNPWLGGLATTSSSMSPLE